MRIEFKLDRTCSLTCRSSGRTQLQARPICIGQGASQLMVASLLESSACVAMRFEIFLQLAFQFAGVRQQIFHACRYCAINLVAVFSPMPGTPGMLSDGIAHQREHIDDLLGALDAPACAKSPACPGSPRRRPCRDGL